MKKLVSMLTIATFLTTVSFVGTASAAPAPRQGTGSVSGIAQNSSNAVMSGVKVQLRNVDNGALSSSTTSGANGAFSFAGLPAGNYVVEIVDAAGKIIGTSASIGVTAGAAITGITVAASAAGAAVAAAGGFASFFASTGGILTGVAVVGGLAAGVVAVSNNGSPSR